MTYGTPPNIGLIGRKRTGKDTAAAGLIERYGFVKHAFADALRDLATRVDPVISGELGGGTEWRYAEAVDHYGYERAKDTRPEIRRILQELGKGVRDIIGPDVWVDALERRVCAETGPVVVTDVRFPNEVARLKALGFVLVKLTRPSALDPTDTHPSEVLTDSLPADHVYENEGSVEALHAFLDGAVLNGAAW